MKSKYILYVLAPAFSIATLLLFTYTGVIEFADLGPSGDFFNGIFGPFIGVLVALITYNAWQAQIEANKIQRIALERSEINNQVMMFIGLLNNFIDRQSVQSRQGLQAINLIHEDAIFKRKLIDEQLHNSAKINDNLWQNFHLIQFNYLDHRALLASAFKKVIVEVIKNDPGFALASSIYLKPEYAFLKNIREMLENGISLLHSQEENHELSSKFFSQSYKLISLSIPDNLKQLLRLELHLIKGEENAKLCSLYEKVDILKAKEL